EGTYYFPPEAVNRRYLRESATHTTCSWKGVANYYDVVVDGQINKDAAWYYPYPKPAAARTKGYIAFWRACRLKRDDVADMRRGRPDFPAARANHHHTTRFVQLLVIGSSRYRSIATGAAVQLLVGQRDGLHWLRRAGRRRAHP